MKRQPKYLWLAEGLRSDILAGQYRPGERLPSEHRLVEQYGLSRQTVRQALAVLGQERLIASRQGSGWLVRETVSTRIPSFRVGVVTTYIGEYIFPGILRGIEDTLAGEGYSPVIAATKNRVDNERRILERFLSTPIDGLLVEGTKTALPNPNLDLYRRLLDLRVPVVFLHGCYPDLNRPVYVAADDRGGGRAAVSYLVAKGHKHIGGVFKNDDIQGTGRYGGYTMGLLEAGLPVVDDRVVWYTTETREAVLQGRLLQALEGCTAVVCYNDEVALGAITLAEAAGRRVPRDLAVVGFDNSVYSELSSTKITTFATKGANMGRIAAAKLLRMMAGEEEAPVELPWELVEKESG